MNANPEPTLLFVINPVSGTGDNAWQDIISNYFTEKKYLIVYHLLEKKPNIEKLKSHIDAINPQKVIAVGGDGTVSMIAKIIAKKQIPLGIIAAGSANGMAKELNIPADPLAALAIIETGEIKKADAIKINNEDICLHLSDIGMNAQLIKYFNEGKLRGMPGYASVVIKTLWRKRKMRLTIKEADNIFETEALMVVLANASKYGTGAIINPEGKLDDGFFEVLIIKQLTISYLLKVLFKFRRFNPAHVEIHHAKSIRISSGKKMHFQIDGEYNGKLLLVEAEVLPAYINFILPGQA